MIEGSSLCSSLSLLVLWVNFTPWPSLNDTGSRNFSTTPVLHLPGETEGNMSKPLSAFITTAATCFKADDFLQNYSLNVWLHHTEDLEDGKDFELIGDVTEGDLKPKEVRMIVPIYILFQYLLFKLSSAVFRCHSFHSFDSI